MDNPKKTVAVNIGENEIAIVQERAARLDISFSAALRLIIQEWAAFLVNQPASPEAINANGAG